MDLDASMRKSVEATQRTFGNGWLKTGDYGYLVDGRVYITGRKKDLIIINGRNYDPQRMEWLVDELPEVRKGSTVAFSRPGTGSSSLPSSRPAATLAATA